jgi:hypothetical protein
MLLYPQNFPHMDTLIQLVPFICILLVAIACVIAYRLLPPQPKRNSGGLKEYARYTIHKSCESAEIRLFLVKKEFRELAQKSPDIIQIWFNRQGLTFPNWDDMLDSQNARGLPTQYSIQSVVSPNEICVIDVGHPMIGDPERKQTTLRKTTGLEFGKYDLIAGISTQYAKSPKVERRQIASAAS